MGVEKGGREGGTGARAPLVAIAWQIRPGLASLQQELFLH